MGDIAHLFPKKSMIEAVESDDVDEVRANIYASLGKLIQFKLSGVNLPDYRLEQMAEAEKENDDVG